MIFEKKKEEDRKYEIYLDYIPFLKESKKYIREILKFQFQFKENFSENFKY